jgi:hypothetical protein
MDSRNNDVIMRNSVFLRIALGTGLILLIPLIAMQFTNEVSWDIKDFIVMGFLLLSTATMFVLVSRRAPRRRRVVIGFIFAAVFVYIWAELAVGIFTNVGS